MKYIGAVVSSEIFAVLKEAGIGVALRVGKLQDSSLVARKLDKTKLILCTSPAYLKRAPALKTLKDLKQHDRILFSTPKGEQSWRLCAKKGLQTMPIHSRATVNSMQFVLVESKSSNLLNHHSLRLAGCCAQCLSGVCLRLVAQPQLGKADMPGAADA